MIHTLITKWVGKASIKQLCRVLGVSRAGYYAGCQRRQRQPQVCVQGAHAKSVFEASGQSYGSRRLSAALRAQGLQLGRHRARTLMRSHALRPRWRRKFVHTTDSRHGLPVAPNVLNRQFHPEANRAWVSDLTYIRTRSGWLCPGGSSSSTHVGGSRSAGPSVPASFRSCNLPKVVIACCRWMAMLQLPNYSRFVRRTSRR